jgi:hypothetical protein
MTDTARRIIFPLQNLKNTDTNKLPGMFNQQQKLALSQLFMTIFLIVVVRQSLLADFGMFRAKLDVQVVALCSKESQDVFIMFLHYRLALLIKKMKIIFNEKTCNFLLEDYYEVSL